MTARRNLSFVAMIARAFTARWILIVAPCSVLIATLFLWQALVAQERAQIEQAVRLEAANVKIEIREQIAPQILALVGMAKRWEKRGAPPQEEWEFDAELYMERFNSFQAIAWVDQAFHARWIVPLKGNEAAKDFSFAFEEERRRALVAARDRREVTVTRVVNLVMGGRGFHVYVPIFRGDEFDGWIVGLFRAQRLLETVLGENEAIGYSVAVYDGRHEINGRDHIDREHEEWGQDTEIELHNITWRVRVWPKAETVAQKQSAIPEAALAVGLLVASLLVAAIHFAQTAQLRARGVEAANRELESEIAERKRAEGELLLSSKALEEFSSALVNFSSSLKQLHRLNTTAHHNLEALFADYLQTGCEILGLSTGVILQIEGRSCQVRSIKSDMRSLGSGMKQELDDTYCAAVLKEKKTVAYAQVGELAEMRSHPAYQKLKLESYIGTPISVNGEVYGVLSFSSPQVKGGGFELYEFEIIELMAQIIGRFIASHQTELERRQAEEALRKESSFVELLQAVATAANEASTVEDAIQTCLDRVCALTGWPVGHLYLAAVDSPGELVPTSLWHFDDPKRFGRLRQVTESTLVSAGIGLPGRVLASREPAWNSDVTNDQNFLRAELTEDLGVKAGFASPILIGREVVGVLEFFSNEVVEPDEKLLKVMGLIGVQLGRVIERKQAEEALRESEEQYRNLFKNSPTGIYRATRDGRILMANPTLIRLLGYSSFDELTSHNWQKEEKEPTASQSQVKELFKQEGEVNGLEVALRTLHDSEIFVRKNTKAVRGKNGTVLYYEGTIEDITERKRALDALERTRQQQLLMKDKFLSHVSHELRSPLSAIYQFVTILLDGLAGDLSREQRDYLEIVFRNVKQLRSMIGDLLEVTRAETGKLSIEPLNFSIADLISDVLIMFKASAAAKDIRLSADAPADLPQIYADPIRVRQILINLIDNGIKFTPEKGSVTVRSDVWGQDPNFLCIEVADTGSGVSPANTEMIFERFYQESNANESSRKGLGLGLHICKELALRQGGRIWVENEPTGGGGSRFFVTLPVAAPSHSASAVVTGGDGLKGFISVPQH